MRNIFSLGKVASAAIVATLLLITTPANQKARPPAKSRSLALNLRVFSFQLKNGLKVLVNEDPSQPNVAVELWSLAGTRHEGNGQFGLAHLYEHMNGARRLFASPENQETFYSHAIDTNAQTRMDYVRYFALVPKTSLDMALAVMADRLDSDPNTLTQARLEADRNIVLNEIRRAEERGFRSPAVEFRLRQGSFGHPHPYAHEVYGLKEDVAAATLEEMRNWALKAHGAANAMLILAGNVSLKVAQERVEHYFASIPPGKPLEGPIEWVPQLREARRDIMEASVPRETVYLSWPGPQWGSADADYLLLIMEMLSSTGNSRLHDLLVQKQHSATGVQMDASLWQLASKFTVAATVESGVDSRTVARTIQAEVENILNTGPTEAELARAKGRLVARLLRSWEQIGFYGERLQAIGEGALFVGDPLYLQNRLRRIEQATVKEIVSSGRLWFGRPGFTLTVKPRSALVASGQFPDRTILPNVPAPFPPIFPEIQRTELPNGLQLMVVQRASFPLVELRLIARMPPTKWQPGDRVLAELMLALLAEGTTTRTGEQIRFSLDTLGVNWRTSVKDDLLTIEVSSPSGHFQEALELLVDFILHPVFSERSLRRLKEERIAKISLASSDPLQRRWRTMAEILYGEPVIDTPTAISGSAEKISRITRKDVIDFWRLVLRPNNASLIAAGDTSIQNLVSSLNRLLAGWQPGIPNKETTSAAPNSSKSGLYFLDRPDSSQTFILMALTTKKLSPVSVVPNKALIALLNRRLNLNLRERKHWTYGVEVAASSSRNEELLYIDVSVQPDRTAEAITEIVSELQAIQQESLITPEEIRRVKDLLRRSIAGSMGTLDDLASAVSQILRFDLPLNHYQQVFQSIENLSAEDIARAAKELLKPDAFTWVVVGDRKTIMPTLEKLDRFTDIHVLSQVPQSPDRLAGF